MGFCHSTKRQGQQCPIRGSPDPVDSPLTETQGFPMNDKEKARCE